ncbi:DNA replication/repair protein RecF [Candidatus Gracilibacteria bacterium]|nr:DNA replication/repair protein RecF [Candidatus Gracilibacteria bacterium]NUJ99352.1 DNA replication/repair protein RecF [Candidatus Gracilibacteria bacterium]
MIKSLSIKNFRNFQNKTFSFEKDINFILGDNGSGKSNILEAISILCGNEIFGLDFYNLVNKEEEVFFIESEDNEGNKVSVSYDKINNIKKIAINGKNTSISKQKDFVAKSIVFHPMVMNMMYLSPSLRRDFLDSILSHSYGEYAKLLKSYKDILKNRNKVLKNIKEGKREKKEIIFWNQKFIEIASQIYFYRFELKKYFSKHINSLLIYFDGKISNISFHYITKVDQEKKEESIEGYLIKNLERDIILGNTHIGPHVDDFDIMLDTVSISHFASRGEAKSIILGLKLLETQFIEEKTQKKPILLIDDLLSEIDEKHKNIILSQLNGYQIIISSLGKGEIGNIIKI